MQAQLSDYEPTIEWDAHLGRYTVSACLETGREELIFDDQKAATDYRNRYMGDISLLLAGQAPTFNSGAAL